MISRLFTRVKLGHVSRTRIRSGEQLEKARGSVDFRDFGIQPQTLPSGGSMRLRDGRLCTRSPVALADRQGASPA